MTIDTTKTAYQLYEAYENAAIERELQKELLKDLGKTGEQAAEQTRKHQSRKQPIQERISQLRATWAPYQAQIAQVEKRIEALEIEIEGNWEKYQEARRLSKGKVTVSEVRDRYQRILDTESAFIHDSPFKAQLINEERGVKYTTMSNAMTAFLRYTQKARVQKWLQNQLAVYQQDAQHNKNSEVQQRSQWSAEVIQAMLDDLK